MLRKLTLGTLGLLVAAACGDATAPGGDFDAVVTQESADTLFVAVGDNVALQSLSVLSSAFNLSAGQAAINAAVAALPDEPRRPRRSADRLRAFEAAAVAFSSASPADLFPPSVQGNTYVYNPETGMYEEDPEATGAPANGVRFILYAVDPILRQVVTPLVEIGYVDLIDESTETANSLHIVGVVGEVTALDYLATASLGGGGVSFTAVGSLSDGDHTANFDLSFNASASGLSIDYLISVAGGDQSIHLLAAGSLDESSLSVTMTVTNGTDTVVFTAVVADGQLEGSITHNGNVVVTFSGSEENPVFVGADGHQLTEREIAALHALAELIGEVFDSFEHLLEPAEFVFGAS